MRALGIDLAWADADIVNETGLAALDPDGSIAAAGWTTGVEHTVSWIERHAGADSVAFIDAPLLVLNDYTQRLCEKQVGQRYGRWKVSANSTHRGSPRLVYAFASSSKRQGGATRTEPRDRRQPVTPLASATRTRPSLGRSSSATRSSVPATSASRPACWSWLGARFARPPVMS